MSWIDELPPTERALIRRYMDAREKAVRQWHEGKMARDLASSVVRLCTSEIARVWMEAVGA